MAVKWRQLFDAGVSLLSRDVEDFTNKMKFFEARQDWRLLAWGYERMVRDLPSDEREKLRALTMQEPNMAELSALPRGTFGREYIEFFKTENVEATSYIDAWPEMKRVIERSWIARRSLKLHDMHHVLLGYSTDPFGEWGITAFTARNNREPNHALMVCSLPFGSYLFYGDPVRLLRSVRDGWRLAGRVQHNLFFVPIEEMYALPIDDVRRRCGIPVRPQAASSNATTTATLHASPS